MPSLAQVTQQFWYEKQVVIVFLVCQVKSVIHGKRNSRVNSPHLKSRLHGHEPEKEDSTGVELQVSDFVAAVYENHWYVGKITDIDIDDEVEISFMERKKQFYQWPRRLDKLWVGRSAILCVLQTLVETGKSRRMFKLAEGDQNKCSELFSARKENN